MRILLLLALMFASTVGANDWSAFCGPNGFSPQAPPEYCQQIQRVPEPGTLWLVGAGVVAIAAARRRARNSDRSA